MLVDGGCSIRTQLLDCVRQCEKLPDKRSVSKQRLEIVMFVEVSVVETRCDFLSLINLAVGNV